jgi:oligopeptidase B
MSRTLAWASLLCCTATAAASPLRPPVAPREAHARTLHGETINDDYFWLREAKQPRTMQYLKAEAAYADEVMAPTKPLQKKLYAEIRSRVREDESSAPYRRGAYEYRSRVEKGKEHSIYCRTPIHLSGADAGKPRGPEQVILDVNTLAKKGAFVQVSVMNVSDDGNLMAYTVDLLGHEDYTLRIRDLRTGRDLKGRNDRREKVASAIWAADNRSLLYSVEDAAKRSYRVYLHRLGEPADKLLYEEKDERFMVDVGRTTDDELLTLSSHSHTQSEVRFVRADAPDAPLTLVAPRSPDHEYELDAGRGTLYIRSNRHGRNFEIATAPVSSPGIASWKVLVPHNDKIMIDGHQAFAGFLALEEREAGIHQIRVIDLTAKGAGAQHRLAFDEVVHDVEIGVNCEYDVPTFRYSYDTPLRSTAVYDYDPRTRKSTLVKQFEVPGGYDPSRYEVRRFEAPSGKVKVPVTLISRKGVAQDGTAPLLIEAYGAYGVVDPFQFSESRVSLLDRGVIVAMAHVRGGGELGKHWHDDGRMLQKLHTFEDTVAVADWLVAQRWTSPEHLAIWGGSAGGLLVGAVLNMRPELFRVAIAQVPFVDVVNTMLDESLPLTVGEFEEWGNPKLAEYYTYMRRYCPYENVQATKYPALLVTTALHDARAPYWEAAKWVARLRCTKTDDRPLVMRIDLRQGGHGGPSGRYEYIADEAYIHAFLLTQLGLGEVAVGGGPSGAATPGVH